MLEVSASSPSLKDIATMTVSAGREYFAYMIDRIGDRALSVLSRTQEQPPTVNPNYIALQTMNQMSYLLRAPITHIDTSENQYTTNILASNRSSDSSTLHANVDLNTNTVTLTYNNDRITGVRSSDGFFTFNHQTFNSAANFVSYLPVQGYELEGVLKALTMHTSSAKTQEILLAAAQSARQEGQWQLAEWRQWYKSLRPASMQMGNDGQIRGFGQVGNIRADTPARSKPASITPPPPRITPRLPEQAPQPWWETPPYNATKALKHLQQTYAPNQLTYHSTPNGSFWFEFQTPDTATHYILLSPDNHVHHIYSQDANLRPVQDVSQGQVMWTFQDAENNKLNPSDGTYVILPHTGAASDTTYRNLLRAIGETVRPLAPQLALMDLDKPPIHKKPPASSRILRTPEEGKRHFNDILKEELLWVTAETLRDGKDELFLKAIRNISGLPQMQIWSPSGEKPHLQLKIRGNSLYIDVPYANDNHDSIILRPFSAPFRATGYVNENMSYRNLVPQEIPLTSRVDLQDIISTLSDLLARQRTNTGSLTQPDIRAIREMLKIISFYQPVTYIERRKEFPLRARRDIGLQQIA